MNSMKATAWYFGEFTMRFRPGVWLTGGWRALGCLFGGFSMVGLLFLGLHARSTSRLARHRLAGCIITALIFFHPALIHDHYYLMFAPAVAILCGQVAWRLEGMVLRWTGRRLAPLLAAVEASSSPALAMKPRPSYRDKLTGSVANWPSLVENEDLLIKALP